MYKERMSKVVATAAKGMAKRGVNEACIMWLYQPVIPQSVKEKLSKIKQYWEMERHDYMTLHFLHQKKKLL